MNIWQKLFECRNPEKCPKRPSVAYLTENVLKKVCVLSCWCSKWWKIGAKIFWKKFKNCLEDWNQMPYLCTRNREANTVAEFLTESFFEKVLEKFGGLKKSSYLCSPFPNVSRGASESGNTARAVGRVRWSDKLWKFFLIDRTTFFEDIEQLSFDTLFGEYFKAIPLRLSYDI